MSELVELKYSLLNMDFKLKNMRGPALLFRLSAAALLLDIWVTTLLSSFLFSSLFLLAVYWFCLCSVTLQGDSIALLIDENGLNPTCWGFESEVIGFVLVSRVVLFETPPLLLKLLVNNLKNWWF